MKRRANFWGRWMIGGLALVMAAQPVNAQGGRERRQGPDVERRQELMRQIQRRFDRQVREALELNDDEMAQLSAVVRDHQRQRAELGRRRGRAQMRVRMLGQEDAGGEALTDESAMETLESLALMAREEAEIIESEQAALLEFLTPVQVLTLQRLRDDLVERLRRMRGQGDRRRRGGGPPGHLPFVGG